MNISDSLSSLRLEIPASVKLIAVSKTKSPDIILKAYEAGHRIFGENKVQEMVEKQAVLPKDIEWHFIGHLQTNKVKYMASFVDMIHAVDSIKLLKEINKHALKNERTISCLLQVHIAEEETKFGLSEEELFALLDSVELNELKNVKISGLMGMATYTDEKARIRKEFSYLNKLFVDIRSKNYDFLSGFHELSMGMSGDYEIAIEEGSTMVRIGSLIFGARS